MSDDTKEKIAHAVNTLLPLYRLASIGLLSLSTFFVGRMYYVVMDDHDTIIRHEAKFERLDPLPAKAEVLSQQLIELQVKFDHHDHK